MGIKFKVEVISIIFIIIIVITGLLAYMGVMNVGELVLGLSTILLGFAIFVLAFTEVEESQKDRRRLRLREQLYGLYSPLMAHINLFVEEDYEHTKIKIIDPFMEKYFIESKYEFLALDKLKELLREYFSTTTVDIRMNRENWKKIMDEIRVSIREDFKNLTKEYTELNRPAS